MTLLNEILDPEALAQEGAAQLEQDLQPDGDDPPLDLIGREVGGRYRITKVIGRGTQGVVYEARVKGLNAAYAVKVAFEARVGAIGLEQLHHEATKAAELRSDHFVNVFEADLNRAEGFAWFAMEYLEGRALKSRIDHDGPMSWEQAKAVCVGVLKALRDAHRKGILHRDVKPTNVMATRDDERWKLVDLGLAHSVAQATGRIDTATVDGTPRYLAPECWDGTYLPASDLYAVGACLVHMLTGKEPFPDRSEVTELMEAHREGKLAESVRGVDLPEGARAVVEKATAVNLKLRYQSAEEFLNDLEPRRGSRVPFRQRWARHLLPVGIAVGVVVVLALCLVTWGPWKPTQQAGATGPEVQQEIQRVVQQEAERPVQRRVDVDILVTEPGNPFIQETPLQKLPAPPTLGPGKRVRIVARVHTPSYLYLVWLDAERKATPIYPWVDGDWKKRAAEERKTDHYRGPLSDPLGAGPSGVESLVLFVGDEPLPADAHLEEAFRDLPRQTSELFSVLYTENGREVRDEPDRLAVRIVPKFSKPAVEGVDPILKTQQLLDARTRGKGLCRWTRAVCFTFLDD